MHADLLCSRMSQMPTTQAVLALARAKRAKKLVAVLLLLHQLLVTCRAVLHQLQPLISPQHLSAMTLTGACASSA
jgi:hypothetical protein